MMQESCGCCLLWILMRYRGDNRVCGVCFIKRERDEKLWLAYWFAFPWSDQTFEAMKTIELLLVHQGPEWTEKHFMKSSLVSFTMRWENRRKDKTGLPDQFITCLLRIFRKFCFFVDSLNSHHYLLLLNMWAGPQALVLDVIYSC